MTFSQTSAHAAPTRARGAGLADPPVPGSDELRAYWVDTTTLAWPLSLLPVGTGHEDVVDSAGQPRPGADLSLSLVVAPQGGARVVAGKVRGSDGLPAPVTLPLRVTGDLPSHVLEAHPNLEGYIALSLTDSSGRPLLDEADVREALTGQLLVVQRVRSAGHGTGSGTGAGHGSSRGDSEGGAVTEGASGGSRAGAGDRGRAAGAAAQDRASDSRAGGGGAGRDAAGDDDGKGAQAAAARRDRDCGCGGLATSGRAAVAGAPGSGSGGSAEPGGARDSAGSAEPAGAVEPGSLGFGSGGSAEPAGAAEPGAPDSGSAGAVEPVDAPGSGGAAETTSVVDAVTGVQTAVVLDHLYAGAARRADLGVTFSQGRPSFSLWAPTAKSVVLLSCPTGDPTGSVPQVPGPAVRTPAVRGGDGCWRVANDDGAVPAGSQYLWEVEVYVPATGQVETNLVTDPYSVALTVDSTRSVAVDLSDPRLAPAQWAATPAPTVASDASRTIYELHLRDFSAADTTVPARIRGTYKAFTATSSAGMRHLARLARAGLSTIHLLPTFDIATIPERRTLQAVPNIPTDAGPASADQQAAVCAVADLDAYNWGYDPFHWMAPEGSYATDGHQDGGARTVEFREMVGALHAVGLQVVLDQVYNHTTSSGQAPTSVLDRIVPGYYHRLDAVGTVTSSTCCANTATENAMAERLMIDSVLWWVRQYKVDGFRFDLMGHHSRDTMVRLRDALDRLSLEADGVDGRAVYLYGEGWSFGEVAGNALFTQACQGQLDGTGIGTFNDRLRDAVNGGGPFDADRRSHQGFGSGLATDPNGHDHRSYAEQAADLAYRTDLVKVGLAGNLRHYELVTAEGSVRQGGDIGFNGSVVGYASCPQETVSYVEAHDNETLYDLLAYKLPRSTTMADRVRMHTLCLATVTLGQSPAFWSAGTELLRSKSLDRDSYNSGDWFNAVDWTGRDNGFGRGLPPSGRNQERWDLQAELLADPALVPSPVYIAAAREQALDLLRLRASTPLFWLGDAELVRSRVSFPGSGPAAVPGVVTMLIDDVPGSAGPVGAEGRADGQGALAGAGPSGGLQDSRGRQDLEDFLDVDPELDGVLVVFNASATRASQSLPSLVGRDFRLSRIQAGGVDEVVKATRFDPATGAVSVPARTVAVLTQAQVRG